MKALILAQADEQEAIAKADAARKQAAEEQNIDSLVRGTPENCRTFLYTKLSTFCSSAASESQMAGLMSKGRHFDVTYDTVTSKAARDPDYEPHNGDLVPHCL